MVEPGDVRALAKAMYEVLTDDVLWEEMSKKGLNQAKKFSWEKTANKMIRIYEKTFWS